MFGHRAAWWLLALALSCAAEPEATDDPVAPEAACRETLAFDPCVRWIADGEATLDEIERLGQEHPDAWMPLFLGGMLTFRGGDERAAADWFERAESKGDADGRAIALFYLSAIAGRGGEPERAATLLQRAVEAARDGSNRRIVTTVLYEQSRRHQARGEYERERRILERILAAHEADPAEPRVRLLLYQLGQASRRLGRMEEAAAYYRRSLDASRAHDDRRREAQAAIALGYIELQEDRPQQALERFREASEVAEGDGKSSAEILVATALLRLERTDEARSILEALTPENPALETRRTQRMAEVERDAGELERAIELFTEAERLAVESERPVERLESISGRAEALLTAGRDAEALEQARRACDLIEQRRESIDEIELRTHFLHTRSDAYRILAAASPSTAQAFVAIERAHARTLVDSLTAAGRTVRARELAEIQRALAPGDLLVEYLLGERRSMLLLASRDEVEIVELRPRREIEALARSYLDVLRRPLRSLDARIDPAADFARFAGVGHELREAIGADRWERMLEADRWIVVADRALHLVPFEALPTETGFAGEHVAVTYLPAAALLTEERAAPNEILLVSAPAGGKSTGLATLEHADAEIDAILPAYGERAAVLRGRAATLDAIRASDRGTLHVAAHATLDGRRGARILLEGGVLDEQALRTWTAAPELVVLSACQSAQGELVGGEGILGLARTLRQIGTRQLVGSLWQADDARTAEFMAALHTELARGTPASRALLHARRTTLADGFVHPFYWAAFVLYGSG